jgi:hypothetical protein
MNPSSGNNVLIGFLLTNGVTNLSMAACPGGNRGFIWSDINKTSIPALGTFCIQEVGGSAATPTLASYLNTNTSFCASSCTLKLSVLRPLIKESGELIPYVEYRIRGAGGLTAGSTANTCFLQYGTPKTNDLDCGNGFRLSNAIPLQSSTITSTAQVKGFKKVDSRRLDQITTTEGLDFTIFQ